MVRIEVISMERMTALLPSSDRAKITTTVNTLMINRANESTLIPNHELTAAWNYTALMFWFKKTLFPSIKSSTFPKARIVLEPVIVSPI